MNRLLKSFAITALAVQAISFQASAQTVAEGLKNLDTEQFNAAGKIFKQLAKTTPTPESYYNLGYYYLKLDEPKLDSARMAFETGLNLDPKKADPLNRIGLGTVKLAMNNRGGAKYDFDAVTKETKAKNPDALYRIAESYTLFKNVNDPAEAVRNIDLAMVRKKDPAYYLVLANAYLIKNEGGPAMTNLEAALPNAKNPALVKTIMGQVWVQGKNYQKALDHFNDAINTDPNFAPAYKRLGDFFVLYGKFDKAAENYAKYMSLSDADDNAKLQYVKLAFTAKDYSNAIKTLNEIKGRIKDPIKYRLEGWANFETNKPELAIPLLDEWISKAGKDKTGNDRVMGQDYGYKGRAFASFKDLEKKKLHDSLAIMHMEKAISMNDSSYNYYADIAKIQAGNKNYKAAINTYRKLIASSKKENIADYSVLGQYLYIDGRTTKDTATLAEAEKVWKKVADNYKEKYPIAYYYVGNCRRAIDGTNPTGRAIPALESYVKYASTNEKDKAANKKNLIDASNYIGNISLLISKDLAKATEYYKKTLEIDPTNTEANAGLSSASGTVLPTTTVTTPPTTSPIKK